MNALDKVSCSCAVNELWTVVLSLDVNEMDWKGAGSNPVMRDVQESMEVPSDHCENILTVYPEPTVGGVNILLIWKEKAEDIVWVRPVTVNWAAWVL